MSSDETEASIIEAGELANTEDKMRRALGLGGGGSGRASADKSAVRHGDRPLQLSSGQVPASSGGLNERRKHRFVQDGEIQYTVERRRSWAPNGGGSSAAPAAGPMTRSGANPGASDAANVNPLQALESSLRTEQATRERMERLLREAQSKIHDLTTNLGHASLASNEAQQALAAASARIEQLEAAASDLQDQLAAAMASRDAAAQSYRDIAEQLAAEREAKNLAEQTIHEAVTARMTLDVASEKAASPRKATTAKPRAKTKEPQPVKWWIKTKPASKKV